MGTVAYLSPEQVTRGVADPRSDVYAAGILLYEMLTGRKPYDGETAIQVAYRHVHDDVPPPSRWSRGCPPSSTTWSPAPPTATRTSGRPTPGGSSPRWSRPAGRCPTPSSTTPRLPRWLRSRRQSACPASPTTRSSSTSTSAPPARPGAATPVRWAHRRPRSRPAGPARTPRAAGRPRAGAGALRCRLVRTPPAR